MTIKSLFALWLPSAISIALLSLELPIIAFIIAASPQLDMANYSIALSNFLFANAFLMPIFSLAVKENVSPLALKLMGYIALAVFIVFNLSAAYFYSGAVQLLQHIFSLSILFIAFRRYLQAACVVHQRTKIISVATFGRVLFSTLVTFVLIHILAVNPESAAIIALTCAAGLEFLLLWRFIQPRFGLSLPPTAPPETTNTIMLTYLSAFMMFFSYLVSSFLIVAVLQNVIVRPSMIEHWALLFALISLSIYPLLDIDGIMIKFCHEPLRILIPFMGLLSLICMLWTGAAFYATKHFLPHGDYIDRFLDNPGFIAACLLTPVLWTIRSLQRAVNIQQKSFRSMSLNIALAVCLSYFSAYVVEPADPYLPIMLFNFIVLFEIVLNGLTMAIKKASR